MFYKDWEPIYKKIAEDFDYKIENDKKATIILNELLHKKQLFSLIKLEEMINNKEVVIFGAGSTLENSITLHKKEIIHWVKISADGATSALLKYNILPEIIVTDLDGDISEQKIANLNGSIIIIHAHGDNISEINRSVPEFKKDIIGSTQIDPLPYEYVYNFGGFTDGDRAVFLASHYNAKKIQLIGFDFNGKIGKYSYPEKKDKFLKFKKLKWCKKLIDLLIKENENIIYL